MKLSFAVVGLKIHSLPIFELKSPNKICKWCFKKSLNTLLVPHESQPLYYRFYPQNNIITPNTS